MNRIATLGVKGGPSLRADGAMPTSSLLELDGQSVVIDAGLGVTRGLVNAGVPLSDLVEIITVAEGEVPFAGQRVRALAVNHPPVDFAYAFRFDGASSVTFSGDTYYHPPLADFAAGSDVLVHEALLPEGIDAVLARTGGGEGLRAHLVASHTIIDDVGKIAAAAGVGRLVLNHLVPVDDPAFTDAMWQARAAVAYKGTVLVAKDGLRILL